MRYYVLAIQKYADFTGRATRQEYWWFVLVNFLILIACGLIDMMTGFFNPQMGIGLLSGLYALVMLIPGISAAVRRLHDTDRSGWWILLPLIPYLGGLALVVMLALKGTPGENRFGPGARNEQPRNPDEHTDIQA